MYHILQNYLLYYMALCENGCYGDLVKRSCLIDRRRCEDGRDTATKSPVVVVTCDLLCLTFYFNKKINPALLIVSRETIHT